MNYWNTLLGMLNSPDQRTLDIYGLEEQLLKKRGP